MIVFLFSFVSIFLLIGKSVGDRLLWLSAGLILITNYDPEIGHVAGVCALAVGVSPALTLTGAVLVNTGRHGRCRTKVTTS